MLYYLKYMYIFPYSNISTIRTHRARRRITLLAAAFVIASPAGAQWRFTAPDAAGAWFAALDTVRLEGAGALSFHRSAGRSTLPLAATLRADSRYDILLFAPLYFPSGSRIAFLEAVRSAATSEAATSPRARFLIAALRQALPDLHARASLASLADLAEAARVVHVPAEQVDRWQSQWNARFAAALAPYLAAEHLDGGMVMVADALGPEGRLFAGVPDDRRDNVVAVGTPLAADDIDGPLYALVRELCFPLVTRAANASPDFGRDARVAAQRTSVAAVRCGADLLDRLLPVEAPAYRMHWQRAASAARSGTPTGFDLLFPPDPVLAPRLRTAIMRIARSP